MANRKACEVSCRNVTQFPTYRDDNVYSFDFSDRLDCIFQKLCRMKGLRPIADGQRLGSLNNTTWAELLFLLSRTARPNCHNWVMQCQKNCYEDMLYHKKMRILSSTLSNAFVPKKNASYTANIPDIPTQPTPLC